MVDVLGKLQKCSFKEIEFPVESIDFGFGHETSEHKFVFRDDPLQASLGRKSMTWRITIPMSENIAKGGWQNLYTETFPELLNACRNKEPGIFEAPDLGAFRAICVNFSYKLDPGGMRDGVRVEAEFVHAPEDTDAQTDIVLMLPTLENVVSLAGALDRVVDKVDWKQEEPPEPTQDPFTALTSIGDQISNARNKTKGKLDNLAYKIDKMNKSIDKLTSAKNWSVKQQATSLKAAAMGTKESLGGAGKTIREHLTTAPMSPLVLASTLKMTFAQFLKLNGELARMVTIPANTTVRYTE